MIDYRLYVITADLPEQNTTHLDVAKEAIRGGATVVQIREKKADSRELLRLAYEIKKLTEQAQIPFIINDRLDVCLAVDADGVHLGQQDMPVEVARRLLGSQRIIGVSATNLREAIEAEQQGADYLGVGPIFLTPSKDDAAEPMGLDGLRAIRRNVRIPLVAIGGICKENIDQVLRAEADGIAVISAITGASDRKKAAQDLLNIIDQCLEKH